MLFNYAVFITNLPPSAVL